MKLKIKIWTVILVDTPSGLNTISVLGYFDDLNFIVEILETILM